jgi:hypothetical protein
MPQPRNKQKSTTYDASTHTPACSELVEDLGGDELEMENDRKMEQEGDLSLEPHFQKLIDCYTKSSMETTTCIKILANIWMEASRTICHGPSSIYDAPSGAIEKLAELLDGGWACKMDAERFIVLFFRLSLYSVHAMV